MVNWVLSSMQLCGAFVLNSLLCIFFACISFLVHWLLSVSAALLCFLFSCCFGAAFAVLQYVYSLCFYFCCCFSNANFLTQFRFFLFRFEDFFLPCSKVGYSTCVLISYFFLGGGGGLRRWCLGAKWKCFKGDGVRNVAYTGPTALLTVSG